MSEGSAVPTGRTLFDPIPTLKPASDQVFIGDRTHSRVLIIAYGNRLRSDDGVAWHVAEQLQGKFPSEEVEIQTLHQLGPELAESISRSAVTIFIDAASSPGKSGEVRVEELDADVGPADMPQFYHSLSPVALLAMAKQLYGAMPKAFSVTAAGEDFEHGEGLSPLVQGAVPKVVRRVEELVHACLWEG